MATYLIFDTETSGFPNKNLPVDHLDQARAVQLACLLVNDKFDVIGSFYSILSLESGKTINPGAAAVHGITEQHCLKYGLSPDLAIELFAAMYEIADVVVAHNIKFDKSIVDIETTLHGYKHIWNKPEVCTMELTTGLCKIPYPSGKSGYKWPKLAESYNHIFMEHMIDAHDALADVKACARILQWLVSQKLVLTNINIEV